MKLRGYNSTINHVFENIPPDKTMLFVNTVLNNNYIVNDDENIYMYVFLYHNYNTLGLSKKFVYEFYKKFVTKNNYIPNVSAISVCNDDKKQEVKKVDISKLLDDTYSEVIFGDNIDIELYTQYRDEYFVYLAEYIRNLITDYNLRPKSRKKLELGYSLPTFRKFVDDKHHVKISSSQITQNDIIEFCERNEKKCICPWCKNENDIIIKRRVQPSYSEIPIDKYKNLMYVCREHGAYIEKVSISVKFNQTTRKFIICKMDTKTLGFVLYRLEEFEQELLKYDFTLQNYIED